MYFWNARQMSWKDSFTDDPAPFFRTKTAVKRLLEQVKAEKPAIHVISRPSGPVAGRKSRFKFPDPKKDCYFTLKVSSRNGKLCLPVCYENQEDKDQRVCDGLKYILHVLSVKTFSLEGKQLTTKEQAEDYYCYSTLSAHRKGLAKKCLGFWFRFFDYGVVFRITFALKIDLLFVKTFFGKGHLSDFTDSFYEDGGVVARAEVEISTRVKSPAAASDRNSVINTAKIFPTLYLNQEYQSIVSRFKDLRQKLHFNELDNFFVQMLEKISDNDLKVVLFLEQSQEACRKQLYETSKQLLKQAVDNVTKCKNKTLLTGRAYLYLSYVHQKDGYLGNAEECLAIARKKLQAMEACEDVGDLCFQEGLVLTNFAQKMPKFALNLLTEAMLKFEQAAVMFSNGLTVDNVLDKQCCSYIRLASLLLQQKTASLNTVQYNTALASKHLEWVAEHLPELSQRTNFQFHVCHMELLYKKQKFAEAKESLDAAFQIAKSCQFEEQVIFEEIPEKSEEDCYFKERLSGGEAANKQDEDFFVDEVPTGYLGDTSS